MLYLYKEAVVACELQEKSYFDLLLPTGRKSTPNFIEAWTSL